jgi:hypothetical protein
VTTPMPGDGRPGPPVFPPVFPQGPAPAMPPGPPEPRRGLGARLARSLAVIGGMRASLVDEYEGERAQSISLALILFATTVEAMVAGAFAVSQAFTGPDGQSAVPWPGVVAFALVWGAIIFVIDRFMVVGLEGIHAYRALIMVIFRGVLAFVLGVVISTPLVLAVFESDIKTEIKLIQAEEVAEIEQQVDRAREDYQDRDAEVREAQTALEEAEAALNPNPDTDPDVQDAEQAAAEAADACAEANDLAAKEQNGQLPPPEGSGNAGSGPQLRALRADAEQRCGEAERAQDAANDARRLARVVPDNAGEIVAQEKKALDELAQQRADAAADVEHLQGEVEEAQGDQSYGLLTSLEGLERVTANDPRAAAGHFWLAALLISLELMPVLFKGTKQALRGWGDPEYRTDYEQACKRQDDGAYTRLDQWESDLTASWSTDSGLLRTNAEDMRERQEELHRAMNGEIVQVQSQLMQLTLREWRREQAARLGVDPGDLEPGPPRGE